MVTMGGGSWTTDSYKANTGAKISAGRTFGYSDSTRTSSNPVPHEDLDPLKVFSKGYIESRDSDDHPNSLPIVLGLDQTGSMGGVPRNLQKRLPGVQDLLTIRGYVEDPQIAIAAYGDLYCDPVRTAIQFSNFESDNRIDENIDNLLLMGMGGGNGGETLSGILYAMTKVRSDSWEKRQKKGYAFFVADEISLDLTAEKVRQAMGDNQPTAPLDMEGLVKEVSKQWEVFILLIDNWASQIQGSEKFYTELFGKKNVLVLEDPDSVPETIALTIGLREGTLDGSSAKNDLVSVGTDVSIINDSLNAVTRAGLLDGTVDKVSNAKPVATKNTRRL